MVQGIKSSKDITDRFNLSLVSQELLHLSWFSQFLLDLLCSCQMIVDRGGLDSCRSFHHEPCLPLLLSGVLVGVVATAQVYHTNLIPINPESFILEKQNCKKLFRNIYCTSFITALSASSVSVFLITKTSGHCLRISNS